ncbi:protein PAT1 homolog 2 [Colossoma macropomum]|uniref:protein PAT1 homolog 2 n=1 Tax=Colossoma macropomum TaxID=42526 RepID=UPI0018652BBD|nr:protein PAT1 homolog 2 [Colossoma macropomum]
MSDSEHPEEKENSTPDPAWPENGSQWSDEEGGGEMEESGLLQDVVEEDEEIDLYNEETFGLDLSAEDLQADPVDLLFVDGNQPPAPPSSPPPSPREPSPPRPKPQIQPQAPVVHIKAMSRRERPQRQLFDDPAVMRTVEGPPSLKSLDSAIVDCGRSSYWGDLNANTWMMASYSSPRRTPASILQDQAIVGVIDKSTRGRMPYGSPNLRSPLHPVGQRRLHKQVPLCPVVPSSPLHPQSPFSMKQRYNQSVFLSPTPPRFHAPQALTPKMMQVRFGPNSPRPSPCYSPFSAPIQRFRLPVLATQFHPQHKRLLNQRPLGSRRKSKNWEHYAELMSAKEKEWIIKLQMMQLQSENPYQDDYYYQEYYRRMEAKLAEEELLGDRSKREPPKLTTPYVTKTVSYTPVVHIEGSLGQVAVSTCYSPRRAIDAVHVHTPEEQKDTRQQRLEVLNTIEKCFIILLGVEEAERTKETVSDEEERRRLMKTVQRGVDEISSRLHSSSLLESMEEFLQCLLVSKGKRLLARLLPFLSQDAARHILTVITTHLPALMSRDVDEALPVLYPPLRTMISTLTFTQLVAVLQEFTSSLPDSKDSRLTLACQNKFGLSLLYALLSQGERLLTSDVPMEPSIGDFETWTDTVFHVARQLSRTSLVEPLFLPSNLLTLFCRYLDKRTVQQLKNNMESSAGYLAVGS